MDMTEARYADIARRMAQSGDWVTPWLDDMRPFWGKPALSFWSTAIGLKLQTTGVLDAARKMGLSLADVTAAAQGNRAAQDRVGCLERVEDLGDGGPVDLDLALDLREAPQVVRQDDAGHGSVWTSTDRTAGRFSTIADHESPPSGLT